MNDSTNNLKKNNSKMVMVVLQGLGGIQSGPNLLTELQQAHTPNLDALARKSACGLLKCGAHGTTPGEESALLGLLGATNESRDNTTFSKALDLSSLALANTKTPLELAKNQGFYTRPVFTDILELVQVFGKEYDHYDFFMISLKIADNETKESNYFDKIKTIEKIDTFIPSIISQRPDVLVVTGDRSRPTAMGKASWHSVPVLINSPFCRHDVIQSFDEIACTHGGLGHIQSHELLPLILGHADRLLT